MAAAYRSEDMKVVRTLNLLGWVLDHMGDGDVEAVVTHHEDGEGFDVDVRIQRKWYHLRITILPEGGACA